MTRKIYLLLSFTILLVVFCFCNKEESKKSIVIRIDIQKMSQLYLSEFKLVKETIRNDYLGTDYVFHRTSDSVSFYMQIGIGKSDKDAQANVLKYLKDISDVLTNGPHLGVSVGDEYWWKERFNNANILDHIAFVRKNLVIIIAGGTRYDKLESLAKNIDDDILKKASYIDFENLTDQ